MTKKIKRAIIKIVPDRGKLYPLSGQISRELFPLFQTSVLEKLVSEAVSVGVEEIVFLKEKKDERLIDYFEDLESQEKELKKRGNPKAEKLKKLREKFDALDFDFKSDLPAAVRGSENFAFITSQKLIRAEKTSLEQLMEVFKTSERPVVGLIESEMGEVETEKIARKLFKVKAFSDEAVFSMIGRGIFTSESKKFFDEAENLKNALEIMLKRGHTVYGSLVEGEVFSLKDELSIMKASIYYGLKSDKAKEIKEYINSKDLL